MATALQRWYLSLFIVAGIVCESPGTREAPTLLGATVSAVATAPPRDADVATAMPSVPPESAARHAAWMRAFPLPLPTRFEETQPASIGELDAHSIFARIRGGVAGLDLATGATLFTERASVYDVSDGRLAIANSAGVALIRAVDASVAWRIASVGSSGIALTGGKVAVLRQCRLTIYDIAAPPRGVVRNLPYQRCAGLQTIGHGFVFALDDFDGAWTGTAYHAIDLASGKNPWSQTDATLTGVTASTVSLEAQGSMLPWAPIGWNATVRLADGVTVSSSPPPVDPHGTDPVVRVGDASFALSRGIVRRYGPLDPAFAQSSDDLPEGGRIVFVATACDDVALHASPAAAFALCEHVGVGDGATVAASATLYRLDPRALREPFARAVATFPSSRGDGSRRGFRWALVDGELAVLARGRLRLFDRVGTERHNFVIPCDDAVSDAGASVPSPFVAVRAGATLVVACRSMTEQRLFAFPDAAR